MAAKTAKLDVNEIDPRSDVIILAYVEGSPTPRFVPGRDLHGADLAKIAYQRALTEQVGNRQVLIAPGETLPEPTRPPQATPARLAKLAEELLATNAFEPAKAAPPPSEPDSPADPAETEA